VSDWDLDILTINPILQVLNIPKVGSITSFLQTFQSFACEMSFLEKELMFSRRLVRSNSPASSDRLSYNCY